jgi:hypothetical protein
MRIYPINKQLANNPLYRALEARLLLLLWRKEHGKRKPYPLPGSFFDPERDAQRIAMAVHEMTGMSYERWDSLEEFSREPYLAGMVKELLHTQSGEVPAAPPLPAPENSRLSVKDTAERLEQKRSHGEKFVSQGKLAKDLGCSKSTIHGAIYTSVLLQKWAGVIDKGGTPRAGSLNKQILDNTPDQHSPNHTDDVGDAELIRLIEEATPEARAWLQSLSLEEQRDFVNDPDRCSRILGRRP